MKMTHFVTKLTFSAFSVFKKCLVTLEFRKKYRQKFLFDLHPTKKKKCRKMNSVKICKALSCKKAMFHTSAVVGKIQAGRYKVTRDRTKPLTYEQSFWPEQIAIKKGILELQSFFGYIVLFLSFFSLARL